VGIYLVPERKLGFFVKIKEDENFNQSDPREIGFAFHGASADIGEKDSFRSGTI
jgi:hypothetical protein